jgi:membrane-associated phospholipid phosphatase
MLETIYYTICSSIINFYRNSVISIPIITFIIGIIFNKYLIYLSIGLIINGCINYSIKKLLSYLPTNIFLRPKLSKGCSASCDSYDCSNKIGFPSGHSQTIWFFITYLFLYHYKSNKKIIHFPTLFCLILLATSISISRLGFLGSNICHSPIQVIVGSILGIILAYYYFYIF